MQQHSWTLQQPWLNLRKCKDWDNQGEDSLCYSIIVQTLQILIISILGTYIGSVDHPEISPFLRFLDPEISSFLQFLDPEISQFLRFLDQYRRKKLRNFWINDRRASNFLSGPWKNLFLLRLQASCLLKRNTKITLDTTKKGNVWPF